MKYLLLALSVLMAGCTEDESAFTIYAYSVSRSTETCHVIEKENGERYVTIRTGDKAVEVGLDDNIVYIGYEGSPNRTKVLIEDGRHYWIYNNRLLSVAD